MMQRLVSEKKLLPKAEVHYDQAYAKRQLKFCYKQYHSSIYYIVDSTYRYSCYCNIGTTLRQSHPPLTYGCQKGEVYELMSMTHD